MLRFWLWLRRYYATCCIRGALSWKLGLFCPQSSNHILLSLCFCYCAVKAWILGLWLYVVYVFSLQLIALNLESNAMKLVYSKITKSIDIMPYFDTDTCMILLDVYPSSILQLFYFFWKLLTDDTFRVWLQYSGIKLRKHILKFLYVLVLHHVDSEFGWHNSLFILWSYNVRH